ncbi:MAG TPA: aldehyde dehydrogenase family protein [Steroidobacter sp.]|uniref:aldehyde dehydrogenase family protein n=1 Tax=Steroidobacter sp. TaxID=1978227 RepID=UPI002ED87DA9
MSHSNDPRFHRSPFKLVIGGELVDGAKLIDVTNPATEQPVAACPVASVEQLEDAIRIAKRAFPGWSSTSLDQRRALMRNLAGAIEDRIELLSALLTAEQGKPLSQAKFEIQRGCAILRHFAEAELPVRTLRDSERERIYERRGPLGIVAAIVPWNFPILLLMNKLGPALLSGNCVIAKPAPTTPLTTLRIGEICAEILPAGVFSVICDANDLGAVLASHRDIAKVAFTGSTETGRKVFQSGAATLKRLTLELGGNDPALILDDANLDEVAPQIFRCAMANSGQVCMAIKRVYVPDALHDDLCRRLADLAAAAIVGDGTDPRTQFGPVQNSAQFEKLKVLLADCKDRGTVASGKVPSHSRGYFIAPTIVRDIPDDARIVQEEQFGPILPVLRYTSVDDALARMNGTEFGLGASVWSTNVSRAAEIAEQVCSGTVWVNRHMVADPAVPFRGARQSGIGAELGDAGLHEFTQAQVINISLRGG